MLILFEAIDLTSHSSYIHTFLHNKNITQYKNNMTKYRLRLYCVEILSREDTTKNKISSVIRFPSLAASVICW